MTPSDPQVQPAGRTKAVETSPYAGLKVLDFTWAAAGPVVTTILGFLGADIVKIEHSSRPDLMRVSDRQYGYGDERGINDSPLFNELAAEKRSVELDLGKPEDLAVAMELAAVADVLVENMRPGKIEKLGMSYAALSEKNPKLIMCSVSGTGRSDVEAPPGYAPIFWAEGGGAWMTGWPDRPPGLVRGPIDLHAAAFACLGVLSLLRRRKATGQGGYLDCSAIEAVAATVGVHLMEAQLLEDEPGRRGNQAPGHLLNDVFPCAGDDQWVALTLRDRADAKALCRVLQDQAGVTMDAGEMDGGHATWERIAAATATLEVVTLAASLLNAGLPSARSTSMSHALSDPRLIERWALQKIPHRTIGEQTIIGLPWTIDGAAYRIAMPAPDLGAHNADVLLDWLGRAPSIESPTCQTP
jgi:benzylsuccinate CoA-transferase BbsF subunit